MTGINQFKVEGVRGESKRAICVQGITVNRNCGVLPVTGRQPLIDKHVLNVLPC